MRVPKYRKHSTRDLGFVEVNKKRTYFPGPFNSHESLTAYADFIKNIGKPQTEEQGIQIDEATIMILIVRFLDWAKVRYVKHGQSTGEYEKFQLAAKPLLELYSELPTSQFGPLALKKVREKYIKSGLCRNQVNKRTSRLKQIFNWGVQNELVPASVAEALRYVSGLRAGETDTRETAPVQPVEDSVVEQTLPHLPPTVGDMVRVQRLIGCRPSEVCNLRWTDIDQSDEIWIYTPWEFKTEHHGKTRLIPIPKQTQEILENYRHRPEEEFIFSPRETVRLIAERKRAARKTPVQPSQVKRNESRAKNPQAKHNEKYKTRAYERAITRACEKAKVQHWSPNQLRHAFATEIRRDLGAEAAQVILGHAQLNTTEIYAEKNASLVKEVARKIGSR